MSRKTTNPPSSSREKVLTLRGNKLPQVATLSNYINDTNQAIRLVDLLPDQSIELDISIDGAVNGQYTYPEGPYKWRSEDGQREGVHTALLAIVGAEVGAKVAFTKKAEVRNSRGRGISISKAEGIELFDLWVNGARSAGIAFEECEGVTVQSAVTVDTSNYQIVRAGIDKGFNVAGSIKFQNCKGYKLIDAISVDHVGNGITATECDGGEWIAPTTIATYGANQYLNASPRHTITGGMVLGSETHRPSAYVLNREEENVKAPPSEGARLINCIGFDVEWAFGIWGNEGDAVEIDEVTLAGGVFLSDRDYKLHKRTKVNKLNIGQNHFVDADQIDPAHLIAIRNLRNGLADLVRKHADWDKIANEREALRLAIRSLSIPIKVEPTPAPPIDRAAALQWMADGLTWFERGKAIFG